MVSPFLLNQNSQQRSQIHKPLSLTNRLMCYFCEKNDDHKKDIDYNQANIFSTSALQDKFDSFKECIESKILSYLIESILEVEQAYHGLVGLRILKQANNVFKLEFQEQQKWTSQGDKIGFLRKPFTQWHSNQILTISEQNLLNTWIKFQKIQKGVGQSYDIHKPWLRLAIKLREPYPIVKKKYELDLQLFFIIQYMLANLRCQTYHPEELITSVCVHTYCRCKIRLTCQKCIAENLHKKDPGYQSCNIWDPDRVMDVLMQYLTYYQIKVELIGTEVLEIQIKILRQVVQVLEDSFSQIESLNNFLAKANNYIEETGNREIDKIIFDVAVLENKSIQEYIYETRETLIKMYEQIKHNPKLPPSKITNKESLELIDRFKQLIADKQGLFKNYCSYKDEYQDYVNEELEFIEDRNIKITQQPIPQKKAKDKLKEKINKQQTEEQNQKQQFQQQQQNQYDFIQLGNSLMNKQDIQTAKSAYKLEIKLNPDNPMAYKKLGECLIGQNKFAKAIAVYEKFQGSELEQIPFHILKAQALIKGDKQLEARSLLFNMIKKYPQSKELKDELMKMKK